MSSQDVNESAVPDSEQLDEAPAARARSKNTIATPELPDLTPTADCVSLDNIGLILDVNVTVSVEVGNARIPIRRLLQMSRGSVLELDQEAGRPMNVLVNGKPIAHGEVVVINDRVGIRLTEVISPVDRVKSIN